MTNSSQDHDDQHIATPKVEGDETRPLGGATSGEQDYVAVNGAGISGEEHVPTADEEIGRDDEEHGRGLHLESQGDPAETVEGDEE